MQPSEVYKYLGVKVSAAGKAQTPDTRMRAMLANLRRAPLKPQQRIHITRHHLVPKIAHQLVLQRVTAKLLLGLDRIVRGEIRGALRLPKDTPLGYFHARPVNGGLGIPCLRTQIPRLRAARMGKLAESRDKDIQALATWTFSS